MIDHFKDPTGTKVFPSTLDVSSDAVTKSQTHALALTTTPQESLSTGIATNEKMVEGLKKKVLELELKLGKKRQKVIRAGNTSPRVGDV